MDLSIIILNYKSLGLVKNCLRAVKDLNLSLAYEVIVVDNNSQDNSVAYLKEHYFDIKLVESGKNLGFSGGNNLGIRQAQGDFILILNPDILVLSKAIENMLDFMKSHSEAGMLGPKLINPDGSLQYSCSRWPDWRLPFYRRSFLGKTRNALAWIDNYLMRDWNHEANSQVDWLYGACLMVRRQAMAEVGLLDERYFMYMEDLDWCRRFWEKGWQVWYLAKAEVIHYHHRESAEGFGFSGVFKKSSRTHLISWLKYFLKFYGQDLPDKKKATQGGSL